MDIELIFKVAGVGIIVSVLNVLLKKAERDEQALMTTIAGACGGAYAYDRRDSTAFRACP